MRIAAIILAAGEGRRMGRPKALVPWVDTSFLGHACGLLARPRVAAVVAVIGARALEVRAGAPVPRGVTVVENEAWEDGMLSSVWCGLDAAEELGADAVLLHPVDHPLVTGETVDRVVAALEQGAFAAAPTHEGRRGHPGGFGREAFAALRDASPDEGARAVLARNADRVIHVEGDAGCRVGLDTPEEWQRHHPRRGDPRPE
jgi:CTP:molybdopterin cytidylyltransferase MocA